jgi:hypothetical protein
MRSQSASLAEGKSLPEGEPDFAGVTIQRDALWSSQPLDGLRQGDEQRLCREIGAHLAVQQDRGSLIYDIEGLGDMLFFARWPIRIVSHRAGSVRTESRKVYQDTWNAHYAH